MRRVVSLSLRRKAGCLLFATCRVNGVLDTMTGVEGGNPTRGTTLPAIKLALHLACPSVEFPATCTGDELPATRDPCMLWREYYSLQHRRPYYHHLPTNMTTFEVPDGFVTRFPVFHRRHGLVVDANRRVYHNSSTENNQSPRTKTSGGGGAPGGEPPSPPGGDGTSSSSSCGRALTLKQKLAAYGGGGLLLYIIVHNTLLAGIFFLLYFLHIDLVGLAQSYGFHVKGGKPTSELPFTDDDDDGGGGGSDTDAASTKKYPSFWATLGISILLNKLLVPLEVTLTLMMAPVLVPRLQPFASKIIPRLKGMLHYWKEKS